MPLDRNGSASAEERQTAVNLAKSVHGVTGVVDRMTLSR
ncbi:MAG: BON domain-containing protein [Elusimicrobiota bacterium]